MPDELEQRSSSLVLYHKIHCGAVYIEKDKYLTFAPVVHLITGMDQNEPEVCRCKIPQKIWKE